MYNGDFGVEEPGHHSSSPETTPPLTIKEVVLVSPHVQPPLPPPNSPSIFQVVISSFKEMKNALAGHQGLDAIHVVTHGKPGDISLGGEHITAENADSFQDEFAALGKSLNPNGELLLHGCNIAQGLKGLELLSVIHGMTGSSVSGASHDVTVSEDVVNCDLDVTFPPREDSQAPDHLFNLDDIGWEGTLLPPVNNLPPSGFTISPGIGALIGFNIFDTNMMPNLDVILSVDVGTLTMSNTMTLMTYLGDGTNNLQFSGALMDVNLALASLSYTPPNPLFVGDATLTIDTTDTGTTETANSVVAIHVAYEPPVNVIPLVDPIAVANIGMGPFTTTYIPLSITDTNPLANLDVTVTGTSGTLTVTNPGGLTTLDGIGTSILHLVGTTASVNAALGTLGYTPDSLFLGNATITVDTTDTVSTLTDFDSVTIHVYSSPVNNLPPVGIDFIALENIGGPIPFSIDDTTPGANLDVTLTVMSGALNVVDPMTLTTLAGNGTGNLHLVGSLIDVNTALITLTYAPNTSFLGDVTLTVNTTDTVSTLTDLDSSTIHVIAVPVNIPPPVFLPPNFVILPPFGDPGIPSGPFGTGFGPEGNPPPLFEPFSPFGPPSGPPPGGLPIGPFTPPPGFFGPFTPPPLPVPDTSPTAPTSDGAPGAAVTSGVTGQTTTREPLAIKNVNVTTYTPPSGITDPWGALRQFTGGTLGSHLGELGQQLSTKNFEENGTSAGMSVQGRTEAKNNKSTATATTASNLQDSNVLAGGLDGLQQTGHVENILTKATRESIGMAHSPH